jgi:hypothetical protein
VDDIIAFGEAILENLYWIHHVTITNDENVLIQANKILLDIQNHICDYFLEDNQVIDLENIALLNGTKAFSILFHNQLIVAFTDADENLIVYFLIAIRDGKPYKLFITIDRAKKFAKEYSEWYNNYMKNKVHLLN